MKRQRGRNRRNTNNNNNNNNHNSNRSMDSNGPDIKVRGNASQIHDKYEALARDAASSGNRVKAENYRQHAEHYLRMMNAQEAAKQAALEEAEAREERRNRHNNSDEDNSSGQEERKPRRQPSRARQNDAEGGDDEAQVAVEKPVKKTRAVKKSPAKEAAGLEVVSPQKDEALEAAADTNAPAIEKTPRRRRAPVRKKPDEDKVTAAAE